MKIGDRVFITDGAHPWSSCVGTVIALDETYGLGWKGHRIELDGNRGETYVTDGQVMSGQPRIDSIRFTYRRVKRPRR